MPSPYASFIVNSNLPSWTQYEVENSVFADEYPEPEAIDSVPEQVRVRLHVVSAGYMSVLRLTCNVTPSPPSSN